MASLTVPVPSVNGSGAATTGCAPRQTPVDDTVARVLAAPFDPSEVKFKPAAVSGNRTLALAYVDARAIQERLDEVCGVAGWQDSYRVLPDGVVVCHLRLKIGEDWIINVGASSGSPTSPSKKGVPDRCRRRWRRLYSTLPWPSLASPYPST
jgi:hypothetical protein